MNPAGPDVISALGRIRKERGWTAAALAREAGVSRQTIYSIEDGSFVPNTAVALRLARVLERSVEEIFSLGGDLAGAPAMQAELLPGLAADSRLVRMCRVGERMTAVPVSVAPSYLPLADGWLANGSEFRTKTAAVEADVPAAHMDRRLLIAGCDPALSWLEAALGGSGMEVVTASGSSRRALGWLRNGRVHAAGLHLRDRATGEYNLPIVRRLLPGKSWRVVTFAQWEQGLVLAPGNPKGIRGVSDLARNDVSIVNRETGAGSREILDRELERQGIDGRKIRGYDAMERGHLPAARAVVEGRADCCIASGAAARCFGLDFIALELGRFDLTFGDGWELQGTQILLDVLNRRQFRKKLETLAGYETGETGRVQEVEGGAGLEESDRPRRKKES